MLQHTTKEMRVVVVKLVGRPPVVACVVREADGRARIRLAIGRHKFSPKGRWVALSQLLREAAPRERELGHVPGCY